MPIIQIRSFTCGVIQFKQTIGSKVITEIKGKYFIMMNISSRLDNFLTAIYANDVVRAPTNAMKIEKLSISYNVD